MRAPGILRLGQKVWTHPGNRDQRAVALGRAVRFQIQARLTRKPVVIPTGHRSRINASLDNGPSILAAYAPRWDHNEWAAWERHLRPGELFVDVGANVGVYTVLAKELGCDVIAVEPDPGNVERIKANLALNPAPSAEIWVLALGDVAGTAHFTTGLDAENRLAVAGERTVKLETYDTMIRGRYAAGVKIDVEGAERMVLEGARQSLLEKRIGLLQIEWNHTSRTNFGESRKPLTRILREVGYELVRPDGDGVLHPSDDLEGADMFARPAAI